MRAALASFGFVFVHPFGDGNGRLSRYLAHYALCQSGALPSGSILPLSAAMRRNELKYLQALKSFSVPARAFWKVTWLDGENFDFEFQGSPSMYRYFDATPCVSFLYEMALEALRKDLKEEVAYLSCYDEVVRRVNDRYDIQGLDACEFDSHGLPEWRRVLEESAQAISRSGPDSSDRFHRGAGTGVKPAPDARGDLNLPDDNSLAN